MSYNIDTWKTKKLENLEIPVKEFFTNKREDFHPKILKVKEQTIISMSDEEITGIEEDGILKVIAINIYGEFSGTFYEEILKPALRKSKGILNAVTIWGGGDSIYKLAVENGKIEEIEVDL